MRGYPSLLSALAVVAALTFVPPRSAQAFWPTDPNINLPLCTAVGDQYYPLSIPDDSGGAIVVWMDHRGGGYTHIYVQRVNGLGVPQWTAGGVQICPVTSGDQRFPAIVPDGAGGAILAWFDYRQGSADVYAQRLDASGAPVWPAEGVALSRDTGAPNNDDHLTMVSDLAGGAIVAWPMRPYGDQCQRIYAQRVTAAGVPAWTTNGVLLAETDYDQYQPKITTDAAEGAIVTWRAYASSGDYGDVYAQRIDASGATRWGAAGTPLCTASGQQFNPAIATDGSGGAIVAWSDIRGGLAGDIYARRISAAGAPVWTADGVPVCTAEGDQGGPLIVTDDQGGAIVTWFDARGSIYAQRVNDVGAIQWPMDGVPVSSNMGAVRADGTFNVQLVVKDGAGGAIMSWWDERGGTSDHIYAQRINASGVPVWLSSDVAVCTAPGNQLLPCVVSDGEGGAIVAWQDSRNGSWDIYAQRVFSIGALDVPTAAAASALSLGKPSPNPISAGTMISFTLPQAGHVSLAIHDLQGRRVRRLIDASMPAGPGTARWEGRNEAGQRVSSGLYFVRFEANGKAITEKLTVVH